MPFQWISLLRKRRLNVIKWLQYKSNLASACEVSARLQEFLSDRTGKKSCGFFHAARKSFRSVFFFMLKIPDWVCIIIFCRYYHCQFQSSGADLAVWYQKSLQSVIIGLTQCLRKTAKLINLTWNLQVEYLFHSIEPVVSTASGHEVVGSCKLLRHPTKKGLWPQKVSKAAGGCAWRNATAATGCHQHVSALERRCQMLICRLSPGNSY